MGLSEPLDDASVTHGICPACSQRLLEEFRRTHPACVAVADEMDSLPDWRRETVTSAG
jgi:hypothetical protein